MSKSILAIAILAVLLLVSSAYYTTPPDGRVGYHAPSLVIENNDTPVMLNQLRGHYVVVTFWSSNEPASRISNVTLDRATRGTGVEHVSVNMDETPAMFAQLRHVDMLQSRWQTHCDSASQDKLRRTWRQDMGYCSFLIDKQGTIIKKDPTPGDLAQL